MSSGWLGTAEYNSGVKFTPFGKELKLLFSSVKGSGLPVPLTTIVVPVV
jgi:hypothetical protein